MQIYGACLVRLGVKITMQGKKKTVSNGNNHLQHTHTHTYIPGRGRQFCPGPSSQNLTPATASSFSKFVILPESPQFPPLVDRHPATDASTKIQRLMDCNFIVSLHCIRTFRSRSPRTDYLHTLGGAQVTHESPYLHPQRTLQPNRVAAGLEPREVLNCPPISLRGARLLMLSRALQS